MKFLVGIGVLFVNPYFWFLASGKKLFKISGCELFLFQVLLFSIPSFSICYYYFFKLSGCEHFLFQAYVNFGEKIENFRSEALFSECLGRGKRSE